ncbi:T9SS type A sorting domain-containing protein [Flavobacterium sp.]|uniref:T9SS type A sorting domain-containing protein n=1 Tax=Flavobacterium sp. TaxID=239 RepID=UPI00286BA7D4|nr:T9SS type A sorting domain-containing protein [Flavobacterium sp.]
MKNLYLTIQLFGISLMAVAQTPLAHITIETPSVVCAPDQCTTLITNHSTIKSTTDYVISSVPYNPTFPFVGGTVIPPSGDDYWSPEFVLPFSFNFYGNCYNSVLVGTNGLITFDLTNNHPLDYCAWPFTQTIPNTNFPIRNAIYGVYQDSNIQSPPVTNPSLQNVNYYVLDTGVNMAPNRVFVVNFNELPMYQCNTSIGLQTSQIVIHETTNIIDILVKSRTACTSWNSGSGLIGIQNQAGTVALTPPGRNTGTWATTNEEWQISPNGSDIPVTFSWYRDGVLLPTETADFITVCPSGNESYNVSMAIANCTTSTVLQSNIISDLVAPDPGLNSPVDLSVCTESPFVYTVDLTSNTNIILGALNPQDYEIAYYDNLLDAQNITNNYITNPIAYSFTENKTIYASIQEVVFTGCHYIKPFELTIIPTVTAPTGAPSQNFTAGQTLADLIISGENLIWYDAAIGGNTLPNTTLLQDDTTYYVTQTVSGCESNRSTNSNRFAVTTNLVLSNESFSANSFSVYPNPVDEMLTINAKENLKSIVIYNAIGQQILHLNPDQKELQINTASFNTGVYFLKLNTQKESSTLKIIKN